ncbi:unnamed protein product [Protopolystoma xenopodis]|uniref:Uncharacterized protein n=1 Tax=Protopolystoma xenopodis TaxID=117903 RepID=A0A3S4ZPJ3_9PLAT|nr:unnamed protein product [Protopolystoma xenopodis]
MCWYVFSIFVGFSAAFFQKWRSHPLNGSKLFVNSQVVGTFWKGVIASWPLSHLCPRLEPEDVSWSQPYRVRYSASPKNLAWAPLCCMFESCGCPLVADLHPGSSGTDQIRLRNTGFPRIPSSGSQYLSRPGTSPIDQGRLDAWIAINQTLWINSETDQIN